MTRYPLPLDTTQILLSNLRKCQNPGLVFDRYTPSLNNSGDKQKALQVVCRRNPDNRILDAYRARLRAIAKASHARTFTAKTDWRFVTGLGRNTPFEVGFTFHRLYGFPVIPGSSLKGLARAWAYFRLQEEHTERELENDPLFAAVFGKASKGEESAGSVGGAIFFEAVPLDKPELELDVMTPHFPDYYKNNCTPPSDSQNPIPIPFLTVKPGVRFGFAVGWRGPSNVEAHTRAVEWLKAGLENLGAGGKTAAGYGYFEVIGG